MIDAFTISKKGTASASSILPLDLEKALDHAEKFQGSFNYTGEHADGDYNYCMQRYQEMDHPSFDNLIKSFYIYTGN